MKRAILVMALIYLGSATLLMLLSIQAQATVSLTGTRLIFDGRFPQASIDVINRDDRQVLLQTWLSRPENHDGDPQTAGDGLPFVLTPPLLQLDGHGRQTLQVLYQGSGMAQHQESLLHLYVLEIPRRNGASQALNIAIRQRINLFYRPPGLTGDPALTPQRLRWLLSADGRELQVSNPSAFHAVLLDVQLDGVRLSSDLLLAPGASHTLALPLPLAGEVLAFAALTDYGGTRDYCAQARKAAPFSAHPLSGEQDNSLDYRQKDC